MWKAIEILTPCPQQRQYLSKVWEGLDLWCIISLKRSIKNTEHKGKMNSRSPAWQFIILLLLLILSAFSCQQPESPAESATDNTSLQTVYEIPEGTAPQRPETYDDIVFCERLFAYRANCPYIVHIVGEPDRIPGPDFVREAEVGLSGCKFAPRVMYRSNIETKAGEIRYDKFYLLLQDSSLREDIARMDELTRKQTLHYKLRQLGTYPDIHVKKFGEGNSYPGAFFGDYQIYFMIEISPQVKPGDYTLHFIVDANGQHCGEVPCVIHVTE